ncbi:MAG: 3-hydroxyacyl-CoA dehydrogenase NAD-binding domain-containing protein [Planctomycetota bacterium]|nr:3-hydroxyacyl-CoA dehydrogenase NAD-binding domain-containing protein [Planctomycetota bacterium]
MDCKRVAVIGSGTMGRGIAHVAALAGYETHMFDIADDVLAKARKAIEKNLQKGVDRGKVTAEAMASALGNLQVGTDLAAAAKGSDFIIEAVPEKLDLKREIFASLEANAPDHAVLATNTSTIPITQIADGVKQPERVIGMHFFNPVHIMKLIEIIKGSKTSDETVARTEEVSRAMGKETVLVNESPGFVTSRMNALIGNEAFRMLEEGVASPGDIDKALKLGLNHPMGPFELVDLVGLDARLNNLRSLHAELGDLYKPSPLLEKMVSEGRLGKKSGKGVYEYETE